MIKSVNAMKNFAKIKSGILVVLASLATIQGIAQPAPKQMLLALSKKDRTLAIVDAATLKIITKLPVGEDPHEVIASADGKKAYVSIYGGGSLHEINVFDLEAKKVLPTIDTRPLYGPHGLAFANNKLWFSAEGSKAVGRYDPATNKLDWSMGTGQNRTHMVYATADGEKVYTTNVSSGTVSILVDTVPTLNAAPQGNVPPTQGVPPPGETPPRFGRQANWEQFIVPTFRGSEGFDVSPNGNELWTASSDDGNIYIVDLNTKKIASKIDAKVEGANRLVFSPDGKLVFVSSLRSGNLAIFDAATHKEVKNLPVGHGAAGILMQPDGTRAFVACTPDDYVAVIDLKTLEVTGRIDVGGNPDGLAWAAKQ